MSRCCLFVCLFVCLFTLAEDVRTFQAALKWFRKRVKVDLL